jgi:SAM-dependent methyltransferase
MANFCLNTWRPEHQAGSYCRDDATVEFYLRVFSLTTAGACVLDLGAGRGESADHMDDNVIHTQLRKLGNRAGRRIGIDVDPAVMENPWLDEAHVIRVGEPYPFETATFDIIICDWVIEHIDDVPQFVTEINRVLKPGGWFCARTTNKWGYVALGSRLVGDQIESRVLRWAQPHREQRDVFPKHYRMNTVGALDRAFPDELWLNCSYATNATPSYHGGSNAAFWLIDAFQKLAPSSMSSVLMVFMQKRN